MDLQIRVVPLGFQQYGNLSNPTTLTGGNLTTPGNITVPPTANAALFTVAGNSTALAYWRDDGVAPGNSSGNVLPPNSPFWYTGDLAAVAFTNGTSGNC